MEKIELFIKKSWNIKVSKNKTNNNVISNGTKNDCDNTQIEDSSKYGIKNNKCPPQMKYLLPWGNDMIDLVHRVKLAKVKSNFQRQLNEDFKIIKCKLKSLHQQTKLSTGVD